MRRLAALTTIVLAFSAVGIAPAAAGGTHLTLPGDYSGSFVIPSDDFTLNCDGYAITGPGVGPGVRLDDKTGVTIKNCEISGFITGIEVASSSSTVVKNNYIHNNIFEGIAAGYSDGNTFTNNTVVDNGSFGFLLSEADNNTFTNNDVSGHTGQQFHFANGSDGNTVIANTAAGGEGGFVFLSSDNNIMKDNAATEYSSNGYGIFENSSYNVLRNNVAEGGGIGFGFTSHDSSHNSLLGNSSTDGSIGFSLDFGATDNTLKGNYAAENDIIQFAIESSDGGSGLLQSDGNDLVNNTAEGGEIGFFLRTASDNVLRGNTASGASGNGFDIEGTYDGDVFLGGSDGNTLTANSSIANGGSGFLVWDSDGNVLRANVAHDNAAGFDDASGFDVRWSDDTELSRNEANDNDGDGILVLFGDGSMITRNTTNRNAASGVAVIFVADTDVDRNTSLNNGNGFSVIATDGIDTVLSRNTACGNSEFDAVDFSGDVPLDPALWVDNNFCQDVVFAPF